MGVRLTLEGAGEVREKLLAVGAQFEGSLQPLFESLGASWEGSFKAHVRDEVNVGGAPFVELAASTRRRRRALRFPEANPILRRRGDLVDSIKAIEISDTELVVGSEHPGAALLNFGGVTSPRSAIPNAVVPSRTFIGLSAQEVDDLFVTLEKFLFGDGSEGEAARA